MAKSNKITTTPAPLTVIDKINEIIDNYLPLDGKAADALKADIAASCSGNAATATSATSATKATQDGSGNTITSTYATKAQAVTSLSASGKTVTYTKADGSTGTFTTQDTTYSLPTASSSTLGGVKVGSGLSISSGVLSATGGGITASSLGTNGYVKFSNGLILQWGLLSSWSSNYTDIYFHVAFTTLPVVQSNVQSTVTASGHERCPANVTTAKFNVYTNSAISWIAIGT